jgi:catechol 2,3-dioxygenase-like lactoylglutathione lyase family enzyme
VAITECFAGIAVTEIGPARAWYERLLGRAADMLPHEKEATWRLADSGWVYVVADPSRAGNGLLTLLVDDLDDQVADTASRGLVTDPIETMANGVRKAAIEDPDGNRITFAQPPSAARSA